MSSTRERRILKELSDIQQDKDNSGVLATPVDPSNLTHLKGTFPGPPDTPYAGGTYTVDIQIPDMYPFKSPVMKFDTKMWHPNISSQTVSPQSKKPGRGRTARERDSCSHTVISRAPSVSIFSGAAGRLSAPSRPPSSPCACSLRLRIPKTRKTPRSPR